MQKIILLTALFSLAIFGGIAQEQANEAKFITNTLTLKGLVEKANTFALDDLQKMTRHVKLVKSIEVKKI